METPGGRAGDGPGAPKARAGQHLTIRIPGAGTPGTPAPALVRSYSLSSEPAPDGYRISVKHEPHGLASGYLTTNLRPGAILDAAAPRGDFVLDTGTGPVLLISAGIGLTPVLCRFGVAAAWRDGRRMRGCGAGSR